MPETPLITTDITAVADILSAGGVAAIPTETVYGLAALVTFPDAIRRVFDIKNRPYDHPLIIHLGPNEDPTRWGHFNTHAHQLATTCWPGPLTLLVPRTDIVADVITGGRDSVALRVPAHPMTQELLSVIQTGLVAPSANTFGHVSPTTAQHVADDLGSQVDIILDGGPCSIGIESTIVDCTTNDVQIVRPGAITPDEITKIIVVPLAQLSGPSRAPGMLVSHYAPRIPMELVQSLREGRDLLMRYQRKYRHCVLLHHPDPVDYAVHLYTDLRKAENMDYDCIIAVMPPNEGIGIAIRDRLTKAAVGSNPTH